MRLKTPGSHLTTLEASAKITTKGQVTIPVEIRRLLGVGPHERVAFVVHNHEVQLKPARGVAARTAGALKDYFPRRPLTPEQERRGFEESVASDAGERGI